jgi:N6-L-threonylcarbamoyladenine synthase
MRDGSLPSEAGGTQTGALDVAARRLPDFVSVTRGPGMRSNLFTGLDTAKGLAVAWQVLH